MTDVKNSTGPKQSAAPFTLEDITAGPQVVGGPAIDKPILVVPVRKPHAQMFFRTHPSPDFRRIVHSLELKEEKEFYLFHPAVAEALNAQEIKLVELSVYIDTKGNVFLWPLPVPPEFGTMNAWHESQRECAARARGNWIRMIANMSLQAYDVRETTAYKDPVWPDKSLLDLITIAFRKTQRYVENADHPVVRKLFPDVVG